MFTPTAVQSQAQPHLLLLVLWLSGITAVRHAAAIPSLRQRNSRLQDSCRLVPVVCMLVAAAGVPHTLRYIVLQNCCCYGMVLSL